MSISIISSNALLSAIANEFYCTIPELLLNTKLKKILKLTNTTMNVVDNLSSILNKSKFDIEFIHNGIQKNKAKVNNLERIFPLSGIFSNSRWRDNMIIYLVCIDAWGIDLTADCLFRYTDMEGVNLYDYTYCNNSDLALEIINIKNIDGNTKLVDDSYQFRMQSINNLYRKYKDVERYLYITGFERNPRSWTILKDTYDFWEKKILESNRATPTPRPIKVLHTDNKATLAPQPIKTSVMNDKTKASAMDDKIKASRVDDRAKTSVMDDKTKAVSQLIKASVMNDKTKASRVDDRTKTSVMDDKFRTTTRIITSVPMDNKLHQTRPSSSSLYVGDKSQTSVTQNRSKTAQQKSSYDVHLTSHSIISDTLQKQKSNDDEQIEKYNTSQQKKQNHDDQSKNVQQTRSMSVSRISDDTTFQRGSEYKNEGCYLIQEAIDRQLNNDIYKIGRSDHIKRRMTTSAEYTNATIIVTMCVKDSVACENELKQEFGRQFVLAEENIDGSKNKERYKGSLDLMRLLFIHICLKYV